LEIPEKKQAKSWVLLVAPVAFALVMAKEESKENVALSPGKPVVTLRGGKALRLSCWLVSGQDTMKCVATVHV